MLECMSKADAARAAARSWRRRRDAVDAERDAVVITCLDAGLIKEEVHVLTGLGRTTIDRIAGTSRQTGQREEAT
jgi:hypothetical protein